MLINCPRCGFSQPNDQYCAQCGIDMQSYKPKEKPLSTRLLNNTGLQIGILLLAAVLVGQYIFNSREPQNWVQKISHFQGFSKSEKTKNSLKSLSFQNSENDSENTREANSSSTVGNQNDSIHNREFGRSRSGDNAAATGSGLNNPANQGSSGAAQDLSSINFKVTYAEVTRELLAKWVTDSSNLGLYQNLESYSAGIIYDFKKRGDSFQQKLKSSDIKLAVGSSNSSLSGTVTEDGSQMLGLITAIEYKSNENEIIHGNISITRSTAQNNEIYPAEFALPKGAVFFLLGALKRGVSAAERAKLDMPPFQILKSPDFMTRKTEFVIIIEPDYK